MARPTSSSCFVALPLLLAVSGCAWMYAAPVPLRTELYPASAGAQARTLLVLLPGRGDDMTDFASHGFIDDLRAAGASVDVVAVDARIGYYMKETIVDRLWTDVLEPARKKGYRQIWIAGISMGGLGTLAVASTIPGAADRLILLAPYLGPKRLIGDIEAAGGPARWTPTDTADPYQRIWQWLKKYREPGTVMPKMTLAFGDKDSLAPGLRLLAQLLPADQVLHVDGGHNWVAWRQLWQREWAAVARGQ
jgi:pimeloyl-ACP methyl ester carboxylesterase